MNNVISWFEIPVAQMERAIAFYEPVMQVSLRRENMDSAELAVFPHQDPLPAGRWLNLTVLRLQRRALLFICIRTIWLQRLNASPPLAVSACLVRSNRGRILALLRCLLTAKAIALVYINPRNIFRTED